jgi:hypothetical protein
LAAPKLKKCRGLYTASNRYDVPEGALVQANNILIVKDGVIQPRWTLSSDATSMATGNVSHWHRAAELNGTLWFAGRDTVAATMRIGYGTPGASFAGVTALSQTEDFPDTAANFTSSTTPWFDTEFLKLGNLLYCNTYRGLLRIESSSVQRIAGGHPCAVSCMPRPIACSLARSGTTTVTATTDFAHGYVPGVVVGLTTAGSADFGTGGTTGFTIVTVPSAATFTYVDATATTTTTLASQGVSALQIVGSSGFLATDDRTAYRAVLVEYDTNGTEYVGEASGRVVVTNGSPFKGAANNKNVQLAVLYPAASLTANTKVELYRAKGVSSAEPGAEYGLVYSKFLSALDVSRGYVWITDINPDTETGLGKPLYTNDSQGGEGLGETKNNRRPASCKTVATWGRRLVQANTFDFPQIDMQLLSTDATAGLQVGDALRLPATNECLLIAVASTTAFTLLRHFSLYTGGTVSADLKHTVLSMLDSLNWASGTNTLGPLATFVGMYTAAPNDLPGRFTVYRRVADQQEFSGTFNLGTLSMVPVSTDLNAQTGRNSFAPKLAEIKAASSAASVSSVVTVTTSVNHRFEVGEYIVVYANDGTTQSTISGTVLEGQITSVTANTVVFTNATTIAPDASSANAFYVLPKYYPRMLNNHQKNMLRVSGQATTTFPGHAEGFPAFSTVKVGAPNANILKCVACKDSLMVFKEDGLFRVVDLGDGALSAELVDPNAILWAKDTAVPINGVIMAWLTKGVAIINESGVVKYVSTNRIEDKLKPDQSGAGYNEPYQLQAYPFTRRAVAYVDETQGLYELRICMATSPSAPYASTVNLTYNIFNDTWVEDDLAVVSEVFYNGNRYIQQGTTHYYQNTAIRSEGTTATTLLTATNFNSTTKVFSFTYSGTDPVVGGSFVNGSNNGIYYVLSASGGSGTMYAPALSAAPAVPISYGFYSPLISTVQWAPVTFNEENQLKLHREIQVMFGVSEIMAAETTTSSDLVSTTETVVNTLGAVTAFATTGVDGFKPETKRFAIPQQHRVGQQLNFKMVIRCAVGAWTILGIGVDGKLIGPKVSR